MRTALLLLLCFWMTAASAGGAQSPAVPTSLEQIRANQLSLAADLKAGRRGLGALAPEQRAELMRRHDWVMAQIAGHTRIESLPTDRRVELFNTLEWMKSVVTDADGPQKVCERTRAVGSNRYTVVCMSKRERDALREATRDSLNRPQMCTRPPCGQG